MEVILYSEECNWYTRCCLLNGGVCYRECPLREAILYCYLFILYLLLGTPGWFNSIMYLLHGPLYHAYSVRSLGVRIDTFISNNG